MSSIYSYWYIYIRAVSFRTYISFSEGVPRTLQIDLSRAGITSLHPKGFGYTRQALYHLSYIPSLNSHPQPHLFSHLVFLFLFSSFFLFLFFSFFFILRQGFSMYSWLALNFRNLPTSAFWMLGSKSTFFDHPTSVSTCKTRRRKRGSGRSDNSPSF